MHTHVTDVKFCYLLACLLSLHLLRKGKHEVLVCGKQGPARAWLVDDVQDGKASPGQEVPFPPPLPAYLLLRLPPAPAKVFCQQGASLPGKAEALVLKPLALQLGSYTFPIDPSDPIVLASRSPGLFPWFL